MSVKSSRAYYILEILVAVMVAVFAANARGATVEQTFEFNENQLQTSKVADLDLIRLDHAGYLIEPGKPQLPMLELRVALPSGMRAESIEIVSAQGRELAGDYNIISAQRPIPVGNYGQPVTQQPADPQVYGSSELYPQTVATLIGQTDLAGQGMAIIRLTPLQYSPAAKKVLLNTAITVRINGGYGYICGDYLPAAASEKVARDYETMLRRMVVNSDDVALEMKSAVAKSGTLPPGGPFDHLIITSSDLADDFAPLAFWHTRRGVRDTVITVDYIYANYTGADNQDKIRDFVADAYSTWGTAYVLIGGEHSQVPFKYRNYVDENIPSDQHYSDFDFDWTVEVMVGRVTASNATEVARYIAKLMKYETDPPVMGYPLEAAMLGMDLTTDWEPPYYTLTAGEALKQYVDTTYFPNRFNVNGIYDSQSSNHKTAFLNALDAGTHLINHCDHSNTTIMGTGDRNHGWYIGNYDADGVDNEGEFSVIFSLGCHPNEMDYNDCIAEHFVIHNDLGGAIAFTGNTRSGWFYVGDPLSLSNELDYKWWQGLFDNNLYHAAAPLTYTKNNVPTGDSYWRYCVWTLNLLGEPELPIWTDLPTTMVADFDATVTSLPYDYTVAVTRTHGQPIADAYVCIWAEGSVYERGYTDADGEITFSLSGATAGDLYVTASKQNFIPFQGQAELQVENQAPSCQFPADTTLLVRDGALLCLPVACSDPDGNLSGGPELVSGPGEIIDGSWCYAPTGDEICEVTVRCEDGGGLFCESSFTITCDHYYCGDADGDELVNISDAVYLINYIFGDQLAPEPLVAGDSDCDGLVNITDAVEIISFIFNGGAAPCTDCD